MLLGKLRAEPLEVEHVDVEVVDQSAEEKPNRFLICYKTVIFQLRLHGFQTKTLKRISV